MSSAIAVPSMLNSSPCKEKGDDNDADDDDKDDDDDDNGQRYKSNTSNIKY